MSHAKTVSPGHKYDLLNLEDPHSTDPCRVLFIRKEPVEEGSSELRTVHNGTTNEAVIEMLIDRLNFLNEKLESKHNEKAIKHLEAALDELTTRTKKREEAGVEGTGQPVEESARQPDSPGEQGDITYGAGDPIPEDMPWDSYLRKNGLETIADVIEAVKADDFTDLKYMNADREKDIRDWLGENL